MTLLKRLEAKYSLDFLKVVKFPNKFESLMLLSSGPLAKELDSRWYQFHWVPKMEEPKKVEITAEKIGQDVTIASKPKTIKDFLNV